MSRSPWFLLMLFGAPLVGCEEVQGVYQKYFGSTDSSSVAAPRRRAPRKVQADPKLAHLRQEAVSRVQKAKARPGWTILKEVNNYEKIAARIAKKQKLPKPTGFEWSAVCTEGGTCKVYMNFWDGRQPIRATWLVSATEVEALDCWALSFSAKRKRALACFKRQAKAAKKRKTPGADRPVMPRRTTAPRPTPRRDSTPSILPRKDTLGR